MPDTRVGGGSFEAIIATLEKLTEAIDLLNQVDDQRAEQIASLEVAQAELRGDLRELGEHVDRPDHFAGRLGEAIARRSARLRGPA